MKSCLLPPILALAVLLGGSTHLGAAPAGTAISYQGQLNDNGVPANGSYEFRFILHDSPAAGVPIGIPRTNAPVAVVGGGFTTSIDFGPGAFNGDARFLEIAVRPAGSAAAFTPLTPRQGFSPMPYALRALEGSAGPQGPAGATGPQGSKGDKGDKGDPGNAGIPGATGPQGLQGVPGPQGLVGPTGATGPAGPKGDKGDTGAQGPQGPAGAGANLTPGIGLSIVGSVISLGTNGAALNSALVFKGNSVVWDTVAGTPGPKGDKGDPGTAGPPGPKGDAGSAGAQGPQGLKGDIGLTGATGPAGPTGATGATGPQGIQGVPGPTGATGPQGAPGPIGLTGATGPKGDLGATGPAGPAGARGVNWRGEWAAGTAYAPGDAVSNGGASWFAKAASTGVTPVAGASWDLLADKGATGRGRAGRSCRRGGRAGPPRRRRSPGNQGRQRRHRVNRPGWTPGADRANRRDGSAGPARLRR